MSTSPSTRSPNARIEQHDDQGLTARPAKATLLAVQADLHVYDF